ncbi:hypothetical protein B2J93_233 [Marssonina coronariae]|uniref:Uncharacterized protein n=1 Tax=Diplocarpon coronariae TaxID=2795749 RepID=A0A218YYS1_9HELO|nr:hypothetical protein B2J93_233 [Marssonina coronariae]
MSSSSCSSSCSSDSDSSSISTSISISISISNLAPPLSRTPATPVVVADSGPSTEQARPAQTPSDRVSAPPPTPHLLPPPTRGAALRRRLRERGLPRYRVGGPLVGTCGPSYPALQPPCGPAHARRYPPSRPALTSGWRLAAGGWRLAANPMTALVGGRGRGRGGRWPGGAALLLRLALVAAEVPGFPGAAG